MLANREHASAPLHDAETGLYYWGGRYYDPKIGRGIQPDRMSVAEHVRKWRKNLGTPNQPPLEINPYAYVANNPLKWIDPTGEAIKPPLPNTDDCKPSEWDYCRAKCAPGKAVGCYVTIKWKLRGIRDGEQIRSEERTVNCDCEESCSESSPNPFKNWKNYWWLPLVPIITPWPDPY